VKLPIEQTGTGSCTSYDSTDYGAF